MSDPTRIPLGAVQVLSASWWLLLRHPLPLLLPFLGFSALSVFAELQIFGAQDPNASSVEADPWDFGLFDIAYYTVVTLLSWLPSAWVSLMAYGLLTEGSASPARNLQRTLVRIVPLTLISIFFFLVVVIGFLAFIIPGLYISARYWVYPMTILVEDSGMGAMSAPPTCPKAPAPQSLEPPPSSSPPW